MIWSTNKLERKLIKHFIETARTIFPKATLMYVEKYKYNPSEEEYYLRFGLDLHEQFDEDALVEPMGRLAVACPSLPNYTTSISLSDFCYDENLLDLSFLNKEEISPTAAKQSHFKKIIYFLKEEANPWLTIPLLLSVCLNILYFLAYPTFNMWMTAESMQRIKGRDYTKLKEDDTSEHARAQAKQKNLELQEALSTYSNTLPTSDDESAVVRKRDHIDALKDVLKEDPFIGSE